MTTHRCDAGVTVVRRWQQLECCQSKSDNQWYLLQKISSVLSVIVLAPGGVLNGWRIPQQPAYLVIQRHWPYFGPKWGSDICIPCDIQEWFARRLLTGWLEESREYLIWERNCAIYFWIFCVNLYLRHLLNCTFNVSSTAMYEHVVAYFTVSSLNPAICLMFYSVIYRVVMTYYSITYKNVVTLFSVFSTRKREREISSDVSSKQIESCYRITPPPPPKSRNKKI